MVLGLFAALAAALAFGVAAVLQALSTSRTRTSDGVDPLLLVRMLHQPAFVVCLVLNGVGFLLHVTALRALPLFLVQAVISSSVAVTALVAVRALGLSLVRQQWVSIGVVCLGLALLAPSAEEAAPPSTGGGLRVALLVTVLLAAGASVAAARVPGVGGAVLLGLLGGVQFGVVAVSARLLPAGVVAVVSDPAAYVLVLAGATGFLLYATAMQHGTVTTTTAALVITQTAVPAVLGIALLGDRVRPGFGALAVAGFALALGGAVTLSRYDRVGV